MLRRRVEKLMMIINTAIQWTWSFGVTFLDRVSKIQATKTESVVLDPFLPVVEVHLLQLLTLLMTMIWTRTTATFHIVDRDKIGS